MKMSAFRSVAIGRVDTNLELGSKVIEVVPIEWIPMRDGELTSNATTTTFETTDIGGNVVKGSTVSSNTIKATWMPSGSNRLTAPNVRRGERVEILQAADDDKYYWRTMGLDDHLRKLETIIFGISADPKEQGPGETTVLSPENMYWFEFSSHSKMLAFRSCQANGEPFLYEMYFDFGVGEFMVKDDIGNFINMISKLKLIHMQNADGTYAKLDRKDIKAWAPQDISAEAVRNVSIKAGQNMDLKAGVKATIDGGGSVMTFIGAGTTLKTPKFVGLT